MRQREMKAVMSAHTASLLGSVAAEVALSVLVYQRTASPFLSSLTLAFGFVPQGVSALLLSGHVDRFRPRRLLVSCDLICAALVALMVVPGTPIAVLLLLAAGIGLVTPMFMGARAALLADVLDGESFVAARSLLRVLSQSALLLGFAIGGVALAAVGARTLLVVDALSFLASAALLWWGTSEHPARASGARPLMSDNLRATRNLLREPVLRRLLLLTWIPSALFCSVDAMATPYAAGRGQDVGLLLAAAALGLIAAEWLAIRIGLAGRPRLVLPVALITGFALLGYAGHPAIQVAAVLNLVAALGGAIGQWVDKSLVDHLDDQVRGRLFAMQGGLLMAVQGIGIAVAGAVAEFVSPHQVLAGAGLLSLIVSYVLVRDVRSQEPLSGLHRTMQNPCANAGSSLT
jgi:MFS family permease